MIFKITDPEQPEITYTIDFDDSTIQLQGSSVTGMTYFSITVGENTTGEDFEDIVNCLRTFTRKKALIEINDIGISITLSDVLIYDLYSVKLIQIFGGIYQ